MQCALLVICNDLWQCMSQHVAMKRSQVVVTRNYLRPSLGRDSFAWLFLLIPILILLNIHQHSGMLCELSDTIMTGSSFNNYSYEQFCDKLCISSLSARRDQLASCFFHKIFLSTSCLHHLIPPRRDNSQTAKLRKSTVYDIPFARTNKFKNSFILYALNNYI